MIDVIAAINFRPEIVGILVVLVGVVVLMGSVYLLLATNTGARLGFLLALTGFFGWMFIMGVTWWIYGIGYKGPDPSWEIDEIVFGELDQSANEDVRELSDRDPEVVAALTAADPEASALTGSQVPRSLSDVAGVNPDLVARATGADGAALLVAGDEVVGYVGSDGEWVSGDAALSFSGEEIVDENGNATSVEVVTYRFDTGGWNVIEGADPFRGEAQAAADAALVENVSSIESTAAYVALGTFDLGGKPSPEGDGVWDSVSNKITNTFRLTHPEHYAVVQTQVAVPVEPQPGEAPPVPTIDTEQPVMSVVMTRDLGSKRLPPALVTLFSLAMLLLLSWMLHARDERAAELEGPDPREDLTTVAQYLPILAMIVLAVVFALGSFLANRLLAPRRATDKKAAPYECGIIPGSDPPSRFPVTFFLVAMIFIIFDIEIIFLYPWAVAHEGLGAFGLGAILIFSALLFESFVYLVGSGVMNWGPVKRILRTGSGEPVVSADRTSTTTVRKVGLDGRGAPRPAAEVHETAHDDSADAVEDEPIPAGFV